MNPKIRTAVLAALFAATAGAVVWFRASPGVIDAAKTIAKKKKSARPAPKEVDAKDDQASTKPAAPKPAPKKQPDPRGLGLRGQILYRLDRNGDFLLDESELPAKMRKELAAADADGDRRLNAQEFIAALEAMPREEPGLTAASGGLATPPPVGRRVPVYSPANPEAAQGADPLRGLDKDGDGQIGLYEWPGGKVNDFHRLDANGDGFVTEDEFRRGASAGKDSSKARGEGATARSPAQRSR